MLTLSHAALKLLNINALPFLRRVPEQQVAYDFRACPAGAGGKRVSWAKLVRKFFGLGVVGFCTRHFFISSRGWSGYRT
jgi:hypothetical protein